MKKLHGNVPGGPVMVVHAGARTYAGNDPLLAARQAAIRQAMTAVWPQVVAGLPAVAAVSAVMERLEDDPSCNAGRGSALQRDGLARLSASLMNGATQKFSGVMLATHLIHPARLALALQDRPESVLDSLGAQLLARELNIAPENPAVPEMAEKWAAWLRDQETRTGRGGTVGAVVRDTHGRLAAATSTGGCSFCTPGRVSDSATVAGNYASAAAGISCTGVGEEIVDDGLAVKIETRVRDGRTLPEASDLALQEGCARQRQYGWIGVDAQGHWVLCCTAEDMSAAAMSTERSEPLFL